MTYFCPHCTNKIDLGALLHPYDVETVYVLYKRHFEYAIHENEDLSWLSVRKTLVRMITEFGVDKTVYALKGTFETTTRLSGEMTNPINYIYAWLHGDGQC